MTQAPMNSKPSLDQTAHRIFDLIQQDLIDVERELSDQLSSNVQIISDMGEYLHDGGGKRIRPALLLLAAKLFNPSITPSVIRMAAVMECLHTATLVHDDIIDDAKVRRGRPAVNRIWGNQLTVLMGDWLYMMAFETTLRERSFEVLDILTSMTRLMTEGELIQLTKLAKIDITVDEYLDIIRRKTAYLFAACTEIGAVLGGASAGQRVALRNFGVNLGIAFQLTDDVLDFTSTESVLGKPAGNDLREGKITLPLIHLVQRGDEDHIKMIETVIREKGYLSVERAEFVRMLGEEGVLALAHNVSQAYALKAKKELVGLPGSAYKTALLEITRIVTERSK